MPLNTQEAILRPFMNHWNAVHLVLTGLGSSPRVQEEYEENTVPYKPETTSDGKLYKDIWGMEITKA